MWLKEVKNAEADEERSNNDEAIRFFFAMIRRSRIVDMVYIEIVEPDPKKKAE